MNNPGVQEKKLTIELTHRDLCAVCSSLNEVCHGVKIAEFEFSSRIGVSREQAKRLLDDLLNVYREAYRASDEFDSHNIRHDPSDASDKRPL